MGDATDREAAGDSVWDDDDVVRLTTTAKLSARGAALFASMVEHLPADAEAHVVDRSALEALRLRLRALVETIRHAIGISSG
jgi:hypothetical protein